MFGYAYKADMQLLGETTKKEKMEQLYCKFSCKSSLHKILEYYSHLESQDSSPFRKKLGQQKALGDQGYHHFSLRNFV